MIRINFGNNSQKPKLCKSCKRFKLIAPYIGFCRKHKKDMTFTWSCKYYKRDSKTFNINGNPKSKKEGGEE